MLGKGLLKYGFQPGAWETIESVDVVTPVTEVQFSDLVPYEIYQIILEILISAASMVRFTFNDCGDNIYQYANHQAGNDTGPLHDETHASTANSIVLGITRSAVQYLLSVQFCTLNSDPAKAMLVAQGFNFTDTDIFTVLNGGGFFPGEGTVILNGTFVADTNWTKGDGWTIAGGVANCDGTQVAPTSLTQIVPPLVVGMLYKVTFDILNFVDGLCRVCVGSAAFSTFRGANGTFTELIVCEGDTSFSLLASATFEADIDNVIVEPAVNSVEVASSAFTGKVILQKMIR